MKLNNLRDLFVEQLRDLYNAERQLVDALPKMAEAASHTELRGAFTEHLSQTKEHVSRLERIFQEMGMKPEGEKCEAMEGLIKEGQKVIKMRGDDSTRDAGLIAAAQRVEHYEIAGYGTVRTYAQMLGENEAASILQQTLDEEGNTDHRLTRIAEQVVNVDAQS